MRIRLISDIHLEFSNGSMNLPQMADESDQVLILAGDIGIANKPYTYIPFLDEVAERFQDVVYILGNHEHYHGSVDRSLDKIKDNIAKTGSIHNVHAVNNEVVRIGDVSFVCSTLWASYNNMDTLCMYEADLKMNDHRMIRTGSKGDPYKMKFKPHHAASLHMEAVNFIFSAFVEEKASGQKVVGVTHHAPSAMSIADVYKTGSNTNLNGAYASKLEEHMFTSKPDLMIHGHTHHSFDYKLTDELYDPGTEIRVVCNPRGYHPDDLNPDFNPELVIEV